MESVYMSDETKGLLRDYLGTMKNPRTKEEYAANINLICNATGKDFVIISKDSAVSFFGELKGKVADGKLSRKTYGTRLSTCRSFASYIETQRGGEYKNPFLEITFPPVENEITEDSIPTLEELDRVMSAAKESGVMDYLIFALATRMCLSSTAIVRLTRDCYREESGKSFLVILPAGATKNNHDVEARYVRMPSDVAEIFKKYLGELKVSDDAGHIFFNEHNRPLRLRNLDARVKKVVSSAGLSKPYTMKDLRNRGILDMVAGAGDDAGTEENVREYLGVQPARMADYVRSAKIVTGCPPEELVNYRLICP